jgi:acyl-coenzyme A synthetase/AMP-(fatty) acid ligase/thioesterase domain-containing protein/acyl carrier protein
VESVVTPITRDGLLNNYWGYVQKTVQRFGDKAFIVAKKGSLSFAEANQNANVICKAISGLTTKTGLGVGLFMKDHLQIIPSMMGVLKSRDYFIPMDVSFPEASLKSMIENAGIKVILTVNQYADQIGSMVGENLIIINIDDLDFLEEIPDPVFNYFPGDIVQILFTSGSTGDAKGAVEDYRYLTRAAFFKYAYQGHHSDQRILQFSTFTYSAPHFMVFAALVIGLTICYYNLKEDGVSGLPAWIRQQEITNYNSTPTVFRGVVNLLGSEDKFPSVRTMNLGGEKRLQKDIDSIKKHFPNVSKIHLGFASTETQAVSSAMVSIDFIQEHENLASGMPVEDLKVYIWDEGGNPLPEGEEGEIVVYGDSLARGYINNPELTRERFIPDLTNPPWQYFKTGDLGKFLPDGQLMHLGRMDNMVKIKGVRIELDGIESHMLAYPGIIQVASKVVEDLKGNKKLASYFVAEKDIQIPISDLRKHLASRLPLHLLPHYLIGLDIIPVTSSGKVAFSQLPLPKLSRPELANDYVPPENELEKKLVDIWEEEIGIDGIGVTDNFFEVGGDSLIGVILFARIEETLGKDLPVSVLLTSPTIRLQAGLLRNEQTVEFFSPIIPINPSGDHSPLFFIPGKGGYPTRIRHLANKIDPRTPVYALQDLDDSQQWQSARSIKTIAAKFLRQIRNVNTQGPIILVGESMGGKIAFEMAQQLLKAGGKAPLLVLLDTFNMQDSVLEQYRKNHQLPFYWMLIKKHISILVKSNWQGKMEYLQFYKETAKPKIRRFLERRRSKSNRRGNFALPENTRRVERANLRLANAYKVQPYPGRVILFKAVRGLNADQPSNGWDKVKLGELVVHPLDCYHGSILFEPAVSQFAAILQQYIIENIRVENELGISEM